MDFTMDIALMATGMQNHEVSEKLSTSALKMAMNTQSSAMDDILEDMESIDVSGLTGVGGLVDILA